MTERHGAVTFTGEPLARAVFVVDRQGTVRHAQIVREITDEPDYDAVLQAVRALA